MIFKSFSSISRHAALAKHLWQGNGSSQPAGAFFISTNQLARHQSQLARRRSEHSTTNNHGPSQNLSCIVSFPGLSQFAALDEDKQQIVELAGSSSSATSTSSGLYRSSSLSSKQPQQPQNQALLLTTSRGESQSQSQSRSTHPARPPRGSLQRHYSSGATNIPSSAVISNEDNIDYLDDRRPSLTKVDRVSLGGVSVEEEVFVDETEDIPELNLSAAPSVNGLTEGVNSDSLDQASARSIGSTMGSPNAPSTPLSSVGLSLTDETNMEILANKEAQNIEGVLTVYSNLLSAGLAPSTEIYANVILSLAEAARIPIDTHHKLVRRRHAAHLSEIVGNDAQALDQYELAESYGALALDIFEASNSFESRNYDSSVYDALAQTCARFRSLTKRGANLPGESLLRVHATNGEVDLVRNMVDNTSASGQAAILEATLQSGDIAKSVALLDEFLNSASDTKLGSDSFESKVLAPIIITMARQSHCADAWRWVQEADADARVARLSAKSLGEIFSHITQSGDVGVAASLFDFIASQKDIDQSTLNDVRADYAMLCIESDSDNLFKVIQESQLRGGVWDVTTSVLVSRHLIRKGLIDLACDVASMHVSRKSVDAKAVFDSLISSLSQHNALAPALCLQLINVFGMQDSEGLLLDVLSNSEFKDNGIVIDLLCQRIEQIPYSEMLGELCLSVEELEALRLRFAECTKSVKPDEGARYERIQSCKSRLGGDYSKTITPESPAMIEDVFNDVSGEIIAYARTDFGLTESFNRLTSAVSRGDSISADAFVHVIEAAYRDKAVDIARASYSMMAEHLGSSTVFAGAVNNVIRMAAKYDTQAAYVALSQLLAISSSWSLVEASSYTSLIKYGIVDEMIALEEAQRYERVNQQMFAAVISRLCKNGRISYAAELLENAPFTDINSMMNLMKAYCKSGQTAMAVDLLKKIEAVSNPAPIVYNMLLRSYVEIVHKRQDALELLTQMKKKKIAFTPQTFALNISAYGLKPHSDGDIENADSVLLQMMEDKIKAEGRHFGALIRLRGVAMGDFKAAVEFYNACIENRRVRPDIHMFRALIETYVATNNVCGTPIVLQDMVQYGVDMDAVIANALIHGWATESFEKAAGLFDYALKSGLANEISFNEIIKAALANNYSEAAATYVNLMAANEYDIQHVVAQHPALSSSFPYLGMKQQHISF